MNADKIPATIITGFLGAGKTSLIRGLLERSAGRRIAVLVNEFGDVGFDASLVAACDDPACRPDEIVELTNGCICCTVADEFLPTMQKLLARDPVPDHIVIETSGLALPQPLVRAFAWPDIRHRVTVDGVVTVVDAEALLADRLAPDPDATRRQIAEDPALDHDSPIHELFEDQLRCADLVVVTKGDLVADVARTQVERRVQAEARDGVPIVHSGGRVLDPRVLIGLASAAETAMSGRESHHDLAGHDHDHDDFVTFLAEAPRFASLDALKSLVAEAMAIPGVLRIKGYVAVDGKSAPAAVQAVGSRIEAWFSPAAPVSGLVVIGEKGLDHRAINAAMAG